MRGDFKGLIFPTEQFAILVPQFRSVAVSKQDKIRGIADFVALIFWMRTQQLLSGL